MLFYIKYFFVLRRYIKLSREGKFDGAKSAYQSLRALETREINR